MISFTASLFHYISIQPFFSFLGIIAVSRSEARRGRFEAPAGEMMNLLELGQVRDKLLLFKLAFHFLSLSFAFHVSCLKQVTDSSTSSGTSTFVDPKGLLTSLAQLSSPNQTLRSGGYFKRTRDTLQVEFETHGGGWLLLLERWLINMGFERCLKSENVWLEAARLILVYGPYIPFRESFILERIGHA
jgi:hypothetical protein